MKHALPAAGTRRIAFTALAATSIEWYDFFLYGTAAAVIFPGTFFPPGLSPAVRLAASFSTFAVAFVARPIGALLFGHFGDRHGRKTPLAFAITLMGLSTCLIGCLPSYAQIGLWAPTSLIVLRLIQGLAIAGQWGGAVLMITETAPAHRRAFYSSFAQIGVPLGVVLANLIFLLTSAVLTADGFSTWGWRLPFLLSASLVALGLYVHRRLDESPDFLAQQRSQSSAAAEPSRPGARRSVPALQALSRYPKRVALGAGAMLGMQIPFYLLTTWIIAYAIGELGRSRNAMLAAVLVGTFAMVPTLPLSALLSDRYGQRRVYVAGALLLAAWSFAIFPLLELRTFLSITLALLVGQMLVGVMYAPQAALFSAMFPTHIRYSGASISYQLGAILGGGFAPLVATSLMARFHTTLAIAFYMAAACLITALSVSRLASDEA